MRVRRILSTTDDESRALSYEAAWSMGYDVFAPRARTKVGADVNEQRARQSTAWWGCLRVISENLSTLPMDQYREDENRIKLRHRPRADWLDFRQGPLEKVDVIGQAMLSLLTDGNAYLATPRDSAGRILRFVPLDPSAVEPEEDTVSGMPVFRSTAAGAQRLYTAMEITHIRGMTMPGQLKGMSPIAHHRETIGLTLAATEYGAAFFGNSAQPSGVVEVDGKMSEGGAKALKANWEDMHRGVGNAGRLGVLTEGAKFKSVTMSHDDAQYIETRRFQVPDIARIFGVPTHLLGHEGSTQLGSSIAEQNVGFVQHTLRAWIERIEAGFTAAQRLDNTTPGLDTMIAIDASGLMRGDYQNRIGTNVQAVREGILTINEARAMEDLPPVEWGDRPISVQVNGQNEMNAIRSVVRAITEPQPAVLESLTEGATS